MPGQSSTGSADEAKPNRAKQGAEMPARANWTWVEAGVWTERMLSALGNGVKGGKWYALTDKVYAPATGRPGVGNDPADHQRWPNAHFANVGLFALHTAWQSARQSR